MLRRNHPTSAAPYTKPLSYNAEKLLNVGAIWGVASGYGCMVLVFDEAVSLVYVHLLKTPGVVFSYECDICG